MVKGADITPEKREKPPKSRVFLLGCKIVIAQNHAEGVYEIRRSRYGIITKWCMESTVGGM